MRDRIASMVLLACIAAALGAGGCADARLPAGRNSPRQAPPRSVDPRVVQHAIMSFAERYVAAMAELYDRAQRDGRTPEARIAAQRLKLVAAIGAMGNAVDLNPVAGLMDMAIMVALTREISQEPWAVESFGPETAAAITATLKAQEDDIWAVTGSYLTPGQLEELHQLTARWRKEHPQQRYVTGARLADFAESKGGGGGAGAAGGALKLADSVFGVVSLDPFHGLDPALREITETRVLAERLFFHLRYMPTILAWQTNSLYDQMLTQPQMTQLFADTTTVARSTTQFSQATSRFSDASGELAQTVEKFRLQLPEQQAKLVAEMNDLVARQREGALLQATTQVSVQRDATLRQLGDTVAAQQDLLTRNLQGVSDQSIDRAYRRTRSLVLITVGAILLALVLYRRFAAPRIERKG